MITVLLISNMRPSVQQPYSGIFVINQFHALRGRLGSTNVTLFAMERTFTGAVGSLFKYIKAFVEFIPHYFKKYDVIHVHFFFPLILLARFYRLFHSRTRIVITFHGSDVSIHMKNKLVRKLFAPLARKAHYTIAVGSELANEINEKLGFYPSMVMSAGVDKKTFFHEPGIKKNYDFIFVGSFTEGKGCDLIAAAIRLLDRKDVRFCFAGRGPYKGEFEKLSRTYSIDLKEKQTQDQLRTLYNQSRFFLLPSRSEAFGLVVTEAMYCGIPALVASAGGLKDQVIDGVNGFFLHAHDSEKLKDLMLKALLLSPAAYEAMASQALRSNEHSSMEYVINQTMAIYDDLAGIKKAA